MDRAAGVGNGDLRGRVNVMTKKNILGFIGVCMAVIFLFAACGVEQPVESRIESEDHSGTERSDSMEEGMDVMESQESELADSHESSDTEISLAESSDTEVSLVESKKEESSAIVESVPENSQVEDSAAEGELQTVTGLLHGSRGEWSVYSAEKGEIPLDTSNWELALQTSFIQVTYKPGETNELISIQWTDDTVPIPVYGIVIDEAHQVISVNGTVYSYDEHTTIGLQRGIDAYPLATSISDITPEDSVLLSIYNQHIYDITINPCSLIITALPDEVIEKLQIYIDGKPAHAIRAYDSSEGLNGEYVLFLRNGSYEVIVSAERYGAVTETIQVTNDTRSLRLDVDFR